MSYVRVWEQGAIYALYSYRAVVGCQSRHAPCVSLCDAYQDHILICFIVGDSGVYLSGRNVGVEKEADGLFCHVGRDSSGGAEEPPAVLMKWWVLKADV